MHGGTIEVRSESNIGSIFTFTLKLDTDGADGKLPALVPEAPDNTAVSHDVRASLDTSSPYTELNLTLPTDKIQLMIVDDDPVNLNVLKSIFANEHYDLFSAINGVEALALLETGVWDLIISDVTMPIMSGYELTARIRERFSIAELPVLLLTASNREKDIEADSGPGQMTM